MKKEKNFNALAGDDSPPNETIKPKKPFDNLDTPRSDPEALRKWEQDLARIDEKFYVSIVAQVAAGCLENNVPMPDLLNAIIAAGKYDADLFRVWWGRNVKNVTKEILPARAKIRERKAMFEGSEVRYAKRRF